MRTQNHRPKALKQGGWISYGIMGGNKCMSKNLQIVRYDLEWVQLIKKAKNMGLTPSEVRVLINKVKKSPQHTS